MAKRRNTGKLVANRAETPAAVPLDVESGDFPDALSYINSLVASREGAEWNCRVYQIISAGRGATERMPFLYEVQLEDLPELESRLGDEYPAGGAFRVQVRENNQLKKNIRLDIASRPGYKPPPPAWATPIVPQPENQNSSSMELFLTRMADMQRASDERMERLITALAKPQAQPSIMDQLAVFSKIQELMPKATQENTQAMFEKGMQFATQIFDARSSGEGGANWMDVVLKALESPLIKDMLAAGIASAAQPQPAALSAPASLIHAGNPIALQAINTLLAQAAAGVDPKFVADNIGNHLPQAIFEELEQQEDIVGFLVARFPQAAAHRPWLERVVAEIWSDTDTVPPSPTLAPLNARPDSTQQPQT